MMKGPREKPVSLFDVPRIVAAIFAEFPEKSVDDMLDLLNAANIGRGKLKWIFTNRFLVLCPEGCGSRRVKLYHQGGRFACSDCWGFSKQKTRYPLKRSVMLLNYVRPLRMLRDWEVEFASGYLSSRRLQLARKKILMLRKTIPTCLQDRRYDPILDNHEQFPNFSP